MILNPFILQVIGMWIGLEFAGTFWHICTTSEAACAKFYPKGRLTWRYFFAVESCAFKHCWSGKSILQSLSAFLDIQDTRIVTLYRGVSQKVEFRSTARMNLQKLVGSVQSELCKTCFAKKRKVQLFRSVALFIQICVLLGFNGFWLECSTVPVPTESSAPNFNYVSPWQALHWIYGVPQDSNEVSTSVWIVINKKKPRDAKGEMKKCKNDVYVCIIFYLLLCLFF